MCVGQVCSVGVTALNKLVIHRFLLCMLFMLPIVVFDERTAVIDERFAIVHDSNCLEGLCHVAFVSEYTWQEIYPVDEQIAALGKKIAMLSWTMLVSRRARYD